MKYKLSTIQPHINMFLWLKQILGDIKQYSYYKTVYEIAENLRINEIILLSSDKAVRPTSVMGVTKRISELIFQAFAEKVQQDVNPLIKYSMVRFGNVLGSSGSVVPLFKEQIANGGPISIAHPEVTRYFMQLLKLLN